MKTEMNVLVLRNKYQSLILALDETKWCRSCCASKPDTFFLKAEIEQCISWKRVLRRNFYCNQQKPVAFLLFWVFKCSTFDLSHLIIAILLSCDVLCCAVMSIVTSSRRKLHSIRLAEPLSKTLDLKQWHMYLCKCY